MTSSPQPDEFVGGLMLPESSQPAPHRPLA